MSVARWYAVRTNPDGVEVWRGLAVTMDEAQACGERAIAGITDFDSLTVKEVEAPEMYGYRWDYEAGEYVALTEDDRLWGLVEAVEGLLTAQGAEETVAAMQALKAAYEVCPVRGGK